MAAAGLWKAEKAPFRAGSTESLRIIGTYTKGAQALPVLGAVSYYDRIGRFPRIRMDCCFENFHCTAILFFAQHDLAHVQVPAGFGIRAMVCNHINSIF